MSLRETIRTADHRETLHDTVAVARRSQVSLLAASLAYFGFLSLFPFAVLVIIVLTALGGESLGDATLALLGTVFGEQVSRQLTEAVFVTGSRTSSTLVSLSVLVWSALRLYRSSDRAFAAVYDDRKNTTLLSTFRDAALVFVTNLLAVVLLGGVGIWFGLTGRVAAVVAPGLLFVALVAVFLPMFYVFPRAEVALREVLPGTVLAAGVWAAASFGFRLYAGTTTTIAYGAAGAVVLVLSWLYVGGLATLLGAALNAVLGGRVDPDDEWVPTDYM